MKLKNFNFSMLVTPEGLVFGLPKINLFSGARVYGTCGYGSGCSGGGGDCGYGSGCGGEGTGGQGRCGYGSGCSGGGGQCGYGSGCGGR